MKGDKDMLDICFYFNEVSMDNEICNNCTEFMNSCNPQVTSIDGYSAVSECDIYLCSGCSHIECIYKNYVNQ